MFFPDTIKKVAVPNEKIEIAGDEDTVVIKDSSLPKDDDAANQVKTNTPITDVLDYFFDII